MMAILGGKNPHPQSLVVGGITSGMDLFNAERMGQYLFRFKEMKNFLETAYIPDVLLAATYYKDEGLKGIGGGVKNYLAYGGFPLDDNWDKLLFPRGIVKDRNLAKVLPLDEKKITEEATHSWYTGKEPQHPYDGTTEPNYTGYDKTGNLKGDAKYSWCKAPRYDGKPYEVGPLARMIVGYAAGDKAI
jgi:quinone-reactive Ni/Fe-hydrogenase large subunit